MVGFLWGIARAAERAALWFEYRKRPGLLREADDLMHAGKITDREYRVNYPHPGGLADLVRARQAYLVAAWHYGNWRPVTEKQSKD